MALVKAHILDEKERTEDIEIKENVTFSTMLLAETVLSGLHKSGFEKPSPIQLIAIPLARCGLDMIVQAKSGTGKTLVFTVVALEMISTTALSTQVLVIAPTREIAVQITQVINTIGKCKPNLKAATFIGGIDLAYDRAQLACCHIAVGTPGRLTQLADEKLLKLENVRLLVLDEADQLLQGSFYNDVMQLCLKLPHNKQVLACSATYTDELASVAEKLMRTPNHVRIGKDSPALLGVKQFIRILPSHSQIYKRHKIKLVELTTLLSSINFNQCLVFSNSQMRAESMCNQLKSSGWPVSFLTGAQPQKERLLALDALCSYKCRILVSTDLSARGLDSEHVDLVVNLDIPMEQATYLHRIGRAGRFGSKGCAITLACEGEDVTTMKAIVALTNVQVYELPDDWDNKMINEDQNEREIFNGLEIEELTDWVRKESLRNKFKNKNGNQNSSPKKENQVNHEAKNKKCVENKNRNENGVKNKNLNENENGIENENINENGVDHVNENNEIENNSIDENSVSYKGKFQNVEKGLNIDSLLEASHKTPKKMDFSFDKIFNECLNKWNDISMVDDPKELKISYPSANLSEEHLCSIKSFLHQEDTNSIRNIANVNLDWANSTIDHKLALEGMIQNKDPKLLMVKKTPDLQESCKPKTKDQVHKNDVSKKRNRKRGKNKKNLPINNAEKEMKKNENPDFSAGNVKNSYSYNQMSHENDEDTNDYKYDRYNTNKNVKSSRMKDQNKRGNCRIFQYSSSSEFDSNRSYSSRSNHYGYETKALHYAYYRDYERNMDRFISSAQKCSALFSYVQSMGRISHKLAKDHFSQTY